MRVSRRPEAIVELGVALVPEGRRLFPRLTVSENLMLGAFRKEARRDIDRNLALAFDTFPALKALRKQLAGTMSGRQQQMLAIARALMSSPRLLLIDEPSVGVSPLLVSQTIAKIAELNKRVGLTVLMAEQNFNQAIRVIRQSDARAAQYVRMSTDFQRYSIQNQAATIAAYALQKQFTNLFVNRRGSSQESATAFPHTNLSRPLISRIEDGSGCNDGHERDH